MSDRTQSSVRTGTPGGDLAAAGAGPGAATGTAPGAATGTQASVSSTQSIPTGTQRAVQTGAPGQPTAAPVPPRGVPVSAPATGAGRAPGPLDAARAAAARNAAGTPARTGKGRKATAKAGGRGPRRARLQLRHIDTWSAFKISLVLSIALFLTGAPTVRAQ